MSTPEESPEPSWVIAANVVRWRRYGEGGQGQRPGTKMFEGGSKVYLLSGWREQCPVVGRPRRTRRYVEAWASVRDLHTFRPYLARGPALLRTVDERGFMHREAAADAAAYLERPAWEPRTESWPDWPHPEPCHCHECLTLGSGR
ncbi:hypothetical protein [Streptomyces sp. NPDC096339]|uniref:hypothetical protein n=1 Tax=Streptomyces sp. NPDC096339 TaxID=3366086 RepID=UPI00380DA475